MVIQVKNNYIKFLLILLCVVSLISVGYAAFTMDLNIENISAMFRLQTDIRITNITLDDKSDDAYSNYEEYNVKEIITGIKLPTNDSYVTYKIDVTQTVSAYKDAGKEVLKVKRKGANDIIFDSELFKIIRKNIRNYLTNM